MLSTAEVGQVFSNADTKLRKALTNNDWLSDFSGKEIFSVYCGTYLRLAPEQVRQAYIEIALEIKPEVFQDIIDILVHFKGQ